MIEIVFCAPDEAAFKAEAARLNLPYEKGQPVINGSLPGGGYIIVIAGTLHDENGAARPGWWGRVRFNADENLMPDLPPDFEQHLCSPSLGGWTADGATLAPEWIGNVALIA